MVDFSNTSMNINHPYTIHSLGWREPTRFGPLGRYVPAFVCMDVFDIDVVDSDPRRVLVQVEKGTPCPVCACCSSLVAKKSSKLPRPSSHSTQSATRDTVACCLKEARLEGVVCWLER
eukprot:m.38068 g.38068  ORF g.38068 m.38068 type:complete len:118 (-) comp6777_c1_seq1:801-1154(-)